MTKKTIRFVTLAVADVAVPASTSGTLPATSHLAAIAILIAERQGGGDWRFDLKRGAIVAGVGETALLAWATHALPADGIVLGWQLAERILPPLLDAAGDGDPEVARLFLDRLMGLITAPSVDLAIPHGGAGAPPLEEVVAAHGIALEALLPGDIESAWIVGDVEALTADVEARVLATWRLWLAEANGLAETARAAFEAWLDQ